MLVDSPPPLMSRTSRQHGFWVVFAFAMVYLPWGSTYLAMRLAVVDVPPFAMGGVRFLAAGAVMLGWCAWSGRRVRITAQDFRHLLAVGILLLSVGNMGVVWSELYVPSGLAALIVAMVPIWVAVIQAWVLRKSRIPTLGQAGLVLGVTGMLVLLWPRIASSTHMGRMEIVGIGLLLMASLAWATGSVLAGGWNLSVDVFTACAWQMILGGSVNFLVALATGQFRRAHWTLHSVSAIVYLIIFGSWIGFSAYNWLLEHVPTPKVATYAYVNPVVAVYLGWLVLGEKVDGFMLAGTVVIVAGVALLNLSKIKSLRQETPQHEAGVPLVEPAGD